MASDGPKIGYFNVHKYAEPREAHGRTKFVSPTDAIAINHDMVISFRHEPSGYSVFFKAFVTSFNESFTSEWLEEVVYGRTDPIQLFKSTTRRISLGLKIPAETFGEAYDNLGRVAQLAQFLYPVYSQASAKDSDKGWIPSQGPLIRLKVMNLAAKPREADDRPTTYASYSSRTDPALGLLGAITSLSINHNLETPDVTMFAKDGNTVLPGLIELSIDFAALHEVDNEEKPFLGWSDEAVSKFNDETFPYGVTLMSDSEAKATATKHKQEIAASRRPTEGVPDANEQQRLAALKRYATLGGKARMKKDLIWLNKMSAKDESTLSAQQKANMAHLSETLQGAGFHEGQLEGGFNMTTAKGRRQARQYAASIHEKMFID